MSEPAFFPRPEDFRAWLEKHHKTEKELLVGFYKKGSGRPSLTWSESVDEALCFGWIDGVRRNRDEESYTIRFTPRKPDSNWSAINVAKVEELTRQGRMRPAGLAAFEKRSEAKTAIYAYEQRKDVKLDKALEKRFRAEKAAWDFFQAQPPGYRQLMLFWVMGAKKEETREKRLARLIEESARGRRI